MSIVSHREKRVIVWSLVIVGAVGIAGGLAHTGSRQTADPATLARSTDAERSAIATEDSKDPAPHAVVIHRPSGPPMIDVESPDGSGTTSSVRCATCHGRREPNRANRRAADLDEFHRGMAFRHGELSCFSCHAPPAYESLRLADGEEIEYPDVMALCRQCHGTQATAYDHGAHGGMTGFWDLDRGPRMRNNCVDCHDPHEPAFPTMIPTFKPRDRRPLEGEEPTDLHD